MVDIEKHFKEKGWYKYYDYWKHDDYPGELSLYTEKQVLEILANKSFMNVYEYLNSL